MPTYRLTLEYEGTRYSGWQEQKNARTVAGELRRARWISTTSRWMEEQLRRIVTPETRIVRVGSGVPDEFARVERSEAGYLLYYGRSFHQISYILLGFLKNGFIPGRGHDLGEAELCICVFRVQLQ